MKKLLFLLCMLGISTLSLGAPVGGASITDIKTSPATPSFMKPFKVIVSGQIHTCFSANASYMVLGNKISIDIEMTDTSFPTKDCLDPAPWSVEVTITDQLPIGDYVIEASLPGSNAPASKNIKVVADYGSIILSPPSGVYLSNQSFDFAIIMKNVTKNVLAGSATLNGQDISQSLKGCLVGGTLKSAGMTFLCSTLHGYNFKTGENTINIDMTLSDDIHVSESLTWNFMEVSK